MVAVRSRPARRDEGAGGRITYTALRVLERPLRRDALPEHTRYADTGCSVHHSCLTCPLVRCRYDEPDGARGLASRNRDLMILQVRREEHLTAEALARRFGVSRRTVFRILAREREGSISWQ